MGCLLAGRGPWATDDGQGITVPLTIVFQRGIVHIRVPAPFGILGLYTQGWVPAIPMSLPLEPCGPGHSKARSMGEPEKLPQEQGMLDSGQLLEGP